MADNSINESPKSEFLIQLEDLSQIKKIKKKISRIKTIIHEKKLNIEMESGN